MAFAEDGVVPAAGRLVAADCPTAAGGRLIMPGSLVAGRRIAADGCFSVKGGRLLPAADRLAVCRYGVGKGDGSIFKKAFCHGYKGGGIKTSAFEKVAGGGGADILSPKKHGAAVGGVGGKFCVVGDGDNCHSRLFKLL